MWIIQATFALHFEILPSQCKTTFLTDGADVKHLTARFDVRVVSTNHLSLTREIRFRQVVEVQILENQKSVDIVVKKFSREKFKQKSACFLRELSLVTYARFPRAA